MKRIPREMKIFFMAECTKCGEWYHQILKNFLACFYK